MEHVQGAMVAQSALACTRCRQSKRRCDKTLPECRLCLRKQLPCAYPPRRKEREYHHVEEAESTAPVPSPASSSTQGSHLAHVLSSQPAATPARSDTHNAGSFDVSEPNLVAFHFLDPRLFHQLRLQIPKINTAMPNSILELVGGVADIQTISTLFFDTIHSWMPIVSKHEFYKSLPSRLTTGRSELFLLVLSMKLCCARITAPKTELYHAVKQFYFDVEASGLLSIHVLQAAILITIYEVGHAIYPAALLSVARCAQYATCLGIDATARPPQSMGLSWIRTEECCRIWWSISILDRFLNLCDPRRHPATPEPHSGTYLPVDDASWDAGTSRPEDAVTIGSSSASRLARYGRFAQAAYLLTQVLNLATERPEETMQLRRTIMALVELAETEGHWKRWGFCTQMAICYSAVLMLEHPWLPSANIGAMSLDNGAATLAPISREAAAALQGAFDMISYFFIENNGWTCYRTSPFISHFLYLAASMHSRYSYLNLRGPADKLGALKQSLVLVNERWLAAGVYLSLLEGQEILLATRQGMP